MKVAFLSDSHLGYGRRATDYPERREDPQRAFVSAIELAGKLADVILYGGDLFDTKDPHWSLIDLVIRNLRSLPKKGPYRIRVYNLSGELLEERVIERVPVVAVHGNHDWNQDRDQNLYTLLEKFENFVYAHRRKVVVEREGEKVCVVGMGWVPDSVVNKVISSYKGIECDGTSFFLFHQGVEGIYPRNPRETLIPPGLFPGGFDYYVGGHLHKIADKVVGGRRFLVPGSTTITQKKDVEMEPRIIYIIDDNRVERVEIPGARRGYIVEVSGGNIEVVKAVERVLERHEGLPPIIKVVVSSSEVDEESIRKVFGGRALIYVYNRATRDVVETMKIIKGETTEDAFTPEFFISIVKEKMGSEWEDWMEGVIRKIIEQDEEGAYRRVKQALGSHVDEKNRGKEVYSSPEMEKDERIYLSKESSTKKTILDWW